jgi:glycosidase
MKTLRIWLLIAFLVMLLAACTVDATETPAPEQATQAPADKATAEPAPTEEPPTPTAEPTAALEPPILGEQWWNETVFYEVFVRSFYDSDGDGIGDLKGLIEKLDYLNDGDPATTDDLGVTGIWLMPITESPSYHGYDVVDYYNIDQEYGTNEDFIRLVEEAHSRGIYIIVDLVMNHSSSQHPWFKEAKAENPEYRDWYIWKAEKPNFRGPWDQPVWHTTPSGFYYGLFWDGMPDMNFRNDEVTETFYDVNRFWLEEMHADGFRLDAIKYLIEDGAALESTPETHAWLQAYHQFYKSVDPNAFTVGEVWSSTDTVLKYTGDQVDIAFAFDLARAFLDGAKGPLNVPAVNEMTLMVEKFPPNQYATFLTNHDQDRVMSVLGDVIKAKLAATMLLTSPGVPFIYYGEEIGMKGSGPHEQIRRPMQWHGENVGAGFTTGTPWRMPAIDYKDVNVALQTDDPDSLLNHYRALVALRNEHEALLTGEWTLVDAGTARIYTYLRHVEGEYFLVVVNMHPNDMAAGDYAFTLETGPLTGPVEAVSLLGLENPSSPTINAEGGFIEYTPFDLIPGQSFAIIQLVP